MSNTAITNITDETATFELVQRQAKLLSSSTLVPKEFQGNMSNCAIGLNIAKRLGADAFMVIQNIDIIHGRPSFRGKFLIAMVNASGRFSPLNFRFDGTGDDYGCTAYAKDRETGEVLEGPKVDWKMVKGEGWLGKPGSKWKTMDQLMFRYRAGAYFANIYAPDITLGMMTSEEASDIIEEPRVAVGRVVDETARIENPYAAEEPDPLPPIEPQPTGEPVMESPVEVSPETEREMLLGEIRDFLAESGVKVGEFAPKCRATGHLKSGVQIVDADVETLRAINSNRVAILEGVKA
jgi:hypothetical protein